MLLQYQGCTGLNGTLNGSMRNPYQTEDHSSNNNRLVSDPDGIVILILILERHYASRQC